MPKLKQTFPKINPEDLVPIEKAAKQLGRGYSRSSILRRIRAGEWQEGWHYIDDRRPGAANRIIKINLAAVQVDRTVSAARR